MDQLKRDPSNDLCRPGLMGENVLLWNSKELCLIDFLLLLQSSACYQGRGHFITRNLFQCRKCAPLGSAHSHFLLKYLSC